MHLPIAPLLAYGTTVRLGQREGDPTMILALLVALVLVRSVARLHLTPMVAALTCFAGALWALMIESWGVATPSIAALAVLLGVRSIARDQRLRRSP